MFRVVASFISSSLLFTITGSLSMNGKIFTVRYVDSSGQIHWEGTGIALIPGVDQYEVIGE